MQDRQQATAHLRVLLVEDSPLLAERLSHEIGHLPAVRLLGTVDGQTAAVAALERQRPDVLILDLNLSEGSGFGVLRYLSDTETSIRTVVYSNYAEPLIRSASARLGGALFLDKACDCERLLRLLECWSAEKLCRARNTG